MRDQLDTGALLTFSFSTLDDETAHIFEPGAVPPSKRMGALRAAAQAGFKTGVSMMPLLPWISDTAENLDFMFKNFKNAGAHYVFPASLSLFGSGPSDGRTLVFRAIDKHYPHLSEKYRRLFGETDRIPAFYLEAFERKMRALGKEYNMADRIV